MNERNDPWCEICDVSFAGGSQLTSGKEQLEYHKRFSREHCLRVKLLKEA
jgi:hypothetical protein